jgi:putative FmdB family regulatory protein
MPTYEYVCLGCGIEFELRQKITDEPRKRCPKCRHKVERKLGKGTGIIFKGSGFYATDYRSSEYQAKAKAERGASDGSKPNGTGHEGKATPEPKGDRAEATKEKPAKGEGSTGGAKPAQP